MRRSFEKVDGVTVFIVLLSLALLAFLHLTIGVDYWLIFLGVIVQCAIYLLIFLTLALIRFFHKRKKVSVNEP